MLLLNCLKFNAFSFAATHPLVPLTPHLLSQFYSFSLGIKYGWNLDQNDTSKHVWWVLVYWPSKIYHPSFNQDLYTTLKMFWWTLATIWWAQILCYTLPNGSRRPNGGHWEKKCMTCGEWIKLGNVDARQGALINHEGNAWCLATAHKNKLEVKRLAAALDDLCCNISISPCTLFASQQPSSFLYTHSPALSFTSGSSTRHILSSECPGVPLVWDPDDVLAIFNSYLWTQHGIREHPLGYWFPMAKYDGADITGFNIQ
jgi:hypothetical protein